MPHVRCCTLITHASHCATPRPAPPRPVVIVGNSVHSVALSAHATRTGASGEADVVVDGTHAASGVAAAEWLAATLDGGDVNADDTGARTGAVDDGHFPGFEGCDTRYRPSMFLLTVHEDDVDVNPLLSLENAAHGGSGEGKDCDGVDRGVTHARLYDDAQSHDDEDGLVDTLEAILGHMSQHEDTG